MNQTNEDHGLLPMIVTETGSDGEPVLEKIICSAISGGADYASNMPREVSLQRITYGKNGEIHQSYMARYIQTTINVDEMFVQLT
jgi:hypothetical protein